MYITSDCDLFFQNVSIFYMVVAFNEFLKRQLHKELVWVWIFSPFLTLGDSPDSQAQVFLPNKKENINDLPSYWSYCVINCKLPKLHTHVNTHTHTHTERKKSKDQKKETEKCVHYIYLCVNYYTYAYLLVAMFSFLQYKCLHHEHLKWKKNKNLTVVLLNFFYPIKIWTESDRKFQLQITKDTTESSSSARLRGKPSNAPTNWEVFQCNNDTLNSNNRFDSPEELTFGSMSSSSSLLDLSLFPSARVCAAWVACFSAFSFAFFSAFSRRFSSLKHTSASQYRVKNSLVYKRNSPYTLTCVRYRTGWPSAR